ncbi:MAG: hypothetical protein RDU20_22405, partial [Desulfomonilaceae bacterium]|nr:hypothetical protein [Desulfomonilaceae bacterium]
MVHSLQETSITLKLGPGTKEPEPEKTRECTQFTYSQVVGCRTQRAYHRQVFWLPDHSTRPNLPT